MRNSEGKVNREEFLSRVAKRTGHTVGDVSAVYSGIISEIEDVAKSGGRLSLTGFGLIYVQTHKGHPVQFGSDANKVSDYTVFKFSASKVFNKKLRGEPLSDGMALDEATV